MSETKFLQMWAIRFRCWHTYSIVLENGHTHLSLVQMGSMIFSKNTI